MNCLASQFLAIKGELLLLTYEQLWLVQYEELGE